MNYQLSDRDMEVIRARVFSQDFSGYRPSVVESPNGDGKLDTEKRYAHIAQKYLHKDPDADRCLRWVYNNAFVYACEVAYALGVPTAFQPDARYSALRVLEYPPGATSAKHTDFDLFTCMLHRNQPDRFKYDVTPQLEEITSPQLHLGEIAELIGVGPASSHEVLPSETWQYSAVFFAIPNHYAILPTGQTVGGWIAERISRSRYDK